MFDNSSGLCLGRHKEFDFFGCPTQELIDMCNACPIRKACKDHGIQYEEFGIWGGLGEEQIAKKRKAMGISINKRRNEPLDRPRNENPIIQHGKIEGYRAETYYKMEHCTLCKKANALRSAEIRNAAKERAVAA